MSTPQRSPECPSENVIRAFAKGEISDSWAQLIANHLCECSACAGLVHRVFLSGSSWNSAPIRADSSAVELCLHHIVEQAKHIPEQAAANGGQRARSMPRRIGRYDIKRLIGVGAFGRVYLAHDRGLERPVAIKIPYRGGRGRDRGRLGQIMREARSAAKLRHPSIVSVFDVGRTRDERVFGVFEYVDGQTLDQLLRSSSMSHQRAVEITIAVAEALDYAHRNGVIHRDLKPSNIILDSSGNPKIADFGLALRDSDLARREFVGTPNYMSPEQLRGETHKLDGATDIWSLGVVLYRMLTKRRPFSAASREDLYEKILTGQPRPPRQHDPQIPAELERICLRCLEKNRQHRYANTRQLIDDLLAYREHAPSARRLEQLAIPCQGLRPFGERDAAMFLPLLPGPVDRRGVPDSLQFWRRCFDMDAMAETQPLLALFGPTGCGKTSFLRAALLPNLPANITPIVVESSQVETELELGHALRARFPELTRAGFVENFARLRTEILVNRGERVLIVLDQFEQWLHGRLRRTPLIDALRQCDGEHVICLLVIRSEFWTATSSLFEELEIRLAEHRNYATLGMFTPEHAKLVLTAFGRCGGQLPSYPQDLSRAQRKFLDLAIDTMAQDRFVAPARISAFAEIMRDKPWHPKSIRHLRGPAGVDLEFLKRCMAELCQETRFGDHRRAAQDLLWSLLPEQELPLRTARKSVAELMQVTAYRERGGYFDELMSILDQRLKLITPEDPEFTDDAEAAPSEVRVANGEPDKTVAAACEPPPEPEIPPPEPETATALRGLKKYRDDKRYYRLTNAYLVPALRDFLTMERRATLRGRMRMRLRELGHAWSLSGDPRHVPSILETLAIAAWTRRTTWMAFERELMRIAWWRAAKWGTAITLVTLLIAVPLIGAYRSLYRRQLVQKLMVTELAQVPDVLSQIDQEEPRIAPFLDAEWQRLNTPDGVPPTDETQAQVVRLAIATLDRYPARAGQIVERIRRGPQEGIRILAAGLVDNPHQVLDQMWRELLNQEPAATEAASERQLRVASALATSDAHNTKWSNAAPKITLALMHARPYQLNGWLDNLTPVAEKLIRPLLDALGDSESRTAIQYENLMESVLRLAAEHPEHLLRAAEYVAAEDLHRVRKALQPHETWVRSALPREFEKVTREIDQPIKVVRPDIGEELSAWLADCGGLHSAKGAVALRIPFDELEDGLNRMYAAGYRPNSLRPYWFQSELFATVCWNRSHRQYYWQAGMSPDELAQQHESLKQQSLELCDLADYRVDGQVRFAGLWLRSRMSEPSDSVLRLEQVGIDHQRTIFGLRTDGYSLHRCLNRIDEHGVRRYSSLWKPAFVSSEQDRSYTAYFGDIDFARTAKAVMDCRMVLVDPAKSQLFDSFETAAAGVQLLPHMKEVDRIIIETSAKYQAGRLHEALADANRAIGSSPSNLELIYLRGKLYVALGDSAGVRQTASLISLAGRTPFHTAYFLLRACLLEGEHEAAIRYLEVIEQSYNDAEQQRLKRLLYAYATALTALAETLQESDPAASDRFRSRAIQVFSEAADRSWIHIGAVSREFEFLRTDQRFLQLIADAGLDGLVSLSYVSDPRITSQWLPFMPLARHESQSEQLADEGWTPHCTTVAYAPIRKQLLAGSIWHRREPSTEAVAALTRRQANLALLRAGLGDEQFVARVLDGEYGEELASQLVARGAGADVSPQMLVRLLEKSTDFPLRYRFLLCALSRYPYDRVPAQQREALLTRLQRMADTEPDAGLRSAAMACLIRWELRDAIQLHDSVSVDKPRLVPPSEQEARNWYLNAVGQTMIVVTPPATFAIGSPASDAERRSNEWVQNRYLNRRYALSATEVMARQFRRFLDDPRVKDYYSTRAQRPQRRDYPEDAPQCGIFFRDACLFCQWLSETEGIPQDQWCYPGIWSEPYQIPSNPLERMGYRLPTEAEWEYACRAGRPHTRYYGNDAEILTEFAWFSGNSAGRNHPVSRQIPNQFGFFDMLGNVSEWCYEPYVERVYSNRRDKFFDFLAAACYDPGMRTVRGGAARQEAQAARSAYRSSLPMSSVSLDVGFRVARTITP